MLLSWTCKFLHIKLINYQMSDLAFYILNRIIQGKGLIGTIPESIGDLSRLTRLVFSSNSFTGGIPSSIGKLENLTQFTIFSDVGGRMPDQFWSLNALTGIAIRSQSVTGSIPTATLGLAAINSLYVQFASFAFKVKISMLYALL